MKKMFGMVALVLAVVFATAEIVDINAAENDVSLVHVVQPGETLYRIGRVHGVAWTVLAEYNGLDNPNLIFPGQRVRILKTPQVLKPTNEITFMYLSDLFDEFIFYTRNNFPFVENSPWARTNKFYEYILRIRYLFEYDIDMFARAIAGNTRNGRLSLYLIMTTDIPRYTGFAFSPFRYPEMTVDLWFKINEMFYETNPCFEYIYNLYIDFAFLHNMFRFGLTHKSRITNAFINNPVDFFEVHYLFHADDPWRSIQLAPKLYLARETQHPFLFDEWFGLLVYAYNSDLSDNARALVRSYMHSHENNLPIFSYVLGNTATRATIFHTQNRNLIYFHFGVWQTPRRYTEWTDNHYWIMYGQASGPLSRQIIYWNNNFIAAMDVSRILLHPFWRWMNVEEEGYYPVCPIWFITLMGHNIDFRYHTVLRNILIIELVDHLAELRDRGHGIYNDILGMLTDRNSIFDPMTRETFYKVQYILAQRFWVGEC